MKKKSWAMVAAVATLFFGTHQQLMAQEEDETNGGMLEEVIVTDTLSCKIIYADRSSKYETGLDDDSVAEVFFIYPETGFADQKSAELQNRRLWPPVFFASTFSRIKHPFI